MIGLFRKMELINDAFVSIIIAAYNVEDYIQGCIESILKQTYKNFELILVDDGSTDRTKAICDRYREKDNRVTVIHQMNQGVGVARNTGLQKARGDYITFIDSDDEVAKQYLENLLRPCIKDSVDISVCRYQYVNQGESYKPIITNNYVVADVDYRIIKAKIIGRCCGTMIKSDVLKNQYFDTDVYVGEDLLFFCRAINKVKRIALIPDQLYCYYIYGESSYNGTYNDKKFTEIVSWNRVLDLFKDRSKHFRNTLYRIYGWIVFSNIMKMEEFNYNDKEKKKYCKRELRRMVWPVYNWYLGGGTRNAAMYPIYAITCVSPRIGFMVFAGLMSLKHNFRKFIV